MFPSSRPQAPAKDNCSIEPPFRRHDSGPGSLRVNYWGYSWLRTRTVAMHSDQKLAGDGVGDAEIARQEKVLGQRARSTYFILS